MQRLLIAVGITLLLAGLLWPWLRVIPFGRLPGDLLIPVGEHTRLYLPVTTMILFSLVVSLILRLFR